MSSSENEFGQSAKERSGSFANERRGNFELLLEFAAHQTDDVILMVELAEGFGLVDCDDPSNPARIVYINDAYERLTGTCGATLIGQPWMMLLAEASDDATLLALRSALLEGEVVEHEFPIRRADGGFVWMSSNTRMVEGLSSGERFAVSTWRDITSQRNLQSRLMQMERVVAIGSLAAGIGHEINNPLAYVSSNIDYCLERWSELLDVLERFRKDHGAAYLDAQLQRDFNQFASALGEAGEGVARVSAIVADLREFTNLRDARLHPVELRRALDSAVNLARNELRQKAQLEIDLEALPLVMGNEVKLSQVFLNLLLNAAQAIPDGASLRHKISVRAHFDEEKNRVEVLVEDNGPGIPSALHGKIFDPFFTTRPRGSGSGLGLAVTQNIMAAHGGSIEVISESGKGATFRLLLNPAQRDEPSGPYQALVLPEIARANLLVVDDEAPILRVIDRLLSRDHTVTGVLDAPTALGRIGAGEVFDVIMCDVMMSRMDGFSFFEILEREHPALARRLIFLTGGALTEAQERFLKARDIPIIYKPFNKQDLLTAIAERQAKTNDEQL